MDLLPAPTWFVGCGNMAGAIVDGWRAAGVNLAGAVAIRPSGKPVEGVRTVASVAEAGSPPAFAILGFKPQKLGEIAPELAPRLSARSVVISMLAGVEATSLRARFPGVKAIVRIMPNVPVAVRRGVVALYSEDADEALQQQLQQLFSVLGFTAWTASEAEFRAIGGVAGAGPAYVARFIDTLIAAGAARGLAPEVARAVAVETVFGTAWLAAAGSDPMDSIVKRVASPRGTTEAGLAVLDPELRKLVDRTLNAAAERSAELAADARPAG